MPEIGKRVEELLDVLAATRSALLATVSGISPGLASVRPRSGSWSVAEILTHLSLVDASVAGLVEKTVGQARSEGASGGGSNDSMISSLDRFRVSEVVMKIPAPASMVPEPVRSIEESLAALKTSREGLCNSLIDSADMDLDAYVRPHPMLKNITAYQWALFVAQHEERHRRQMERTINEVTELAAECAPLV